MEAVKCPCGKVIKNSYGRQSEDDEIFNGLCREKEREKERGKERVCVYERERGREAHTHTLTQRTTSPLM